MHFVLHTHKAILFDREYPLMFPSPQLDETTWTAFFTISEVDLFLCNVNSVAFASFCSLTY